MSSKSKTSRIAVIVRAVIKRMTTVEQLSENCRELGRRAREIIAELETTDAADPRRVALERESMDLLRQQMDIMDATYMVPRVEAVLAHAERNANRGWSKVFEVGFDTLVDAIGDRKTPRGAIERVGRMLGITGRR